MDHYMLAPPVHPTLAAGIETMAKTLTIIARELRDFLLSNGGPRAIHELTRLQHVKRNAKDKLEKDTQWQAEHQRTAEGGGPHCPTMQSQTDAALAQPMHAPITIHRRCQVT